MAARIAQRNAVLTAAGQSWRWQLRDKNGQWIEMGAKVKWMANGLSRLGTVVGSHKEGEADVEESKTKRRLRVAANRLTVLANDAELAVDKRTGGSNDRGSVLVGLRTGSQPEPDTVPDPKAEINIAPDLPPARLDGSSEEPKPGANERMRKFFGRSRNKDGSRRPGRTEAEGATGTEEDPIYVGSDVDKAVDLLVKGKNIRMDESRSVTTVVQQLGPALTKADADIRAKYNIPEGKSYLDYPEGSKEREALQSLGLNMCAIQVPGTNVFCVKNKGIPRIAMPQLAGKDKDTGKEKNVQPWAEEMLDSMDLIGPNKTIKADTVTASQSELGAVQVSGMLQSYQNFKKRRAEINAMPDGPGKTAAYAEFMKRARAKGDTTYMSEEVLTAPILVSKDGYIIDGHHRWATLIADDLADGGLGDVDMNVRVVDMEIGEALKTVLEFSDAAGIVKKAPKGMAAEDVPVPEILQKAKVRKEIERYIAANMEKIKARVDTGSTEGILASAVQEGDVLFGLLASGEGVGYRVLRIVAETSGGRSFVREDIVTGTLSLAVVAPQDLVVVL